MTFIGNSAFYDCQSLTDIQLPSSLVTIDENAFLGCSSLTSLVVPNHVTSIGEDAFDECPGILTLTLPASLTEIGDEAFKGCKKLKEIHSKITNLFSFNRDVFGSVSKSQCKLYVPKGMVEDYRNHLVWGEFLSILEDANMLGDVNGDGRVDIADVNAVINMMLGKATQTAAGDVTGDGSVDIADVNAVINLMLGK
ncbi:MAG: leucine-rich repeat protein [Muribaculaceae bacterium]|nr:leucine-rich repeat protein [Muribaculaceae bacterium]